MRACLFGTYNRSHSANRVLAQALELCGYDLVEIHRPLWENTRDKTASYFAPLGLLRLAWHWAVAAVGLGREWQRTGGAPLVAVGFNGQLDLLLLRLIAPRYGPRVVFAPLVSITETLVDDRGLYSRTSLMGGFLAALDRLACRTADVVVVDSEAHADYFAERLGVPRAKLHVCYLGVDTSAFPLDGPSAAPTRTTAVADSPGEEPSASTGKQSCEILYFGQYLPLHGLDVVAGAVEALAARRDVRFVFVGTGEARGRIESRLAACRASTEFVDWVPYEKLAERIARADIVLGIFGTSAKARMVIPNKVYQAAGVGRAVITADTPALREVFHANENIVLCPAESSSLADAIIRLCEAPDLRRRIGENARALMARRFSDAATTGAWTPALMPSSPSTGVQPGGDSLEASPPVRIGIAVLNYRDSAATLACIDSVLADRELRADPCLRPGEPTPPGPRPLPRLQADILVVDNGGAPGEVNSLQAALDDRAGVRLLRLPSNRGYAGGNNRAMHELFAAGADYVLLLNDDARVAPGAVGEMVSCARGRPRVGLVGPTVFGDHLGASTAHAPASIGERCWPALAWLPRQLLRYRRRRQRPYPVQGLLGCAWLVTRFAFETLGGLDEDYFAYYEEVDYCLRARASGVPVYIAPSAEVFHGGHRGFAGGMTPLSAYLKARNLWLLAQRRSRAAARIVFVPGYFALLAASMALYTVSGHSRLARALGAGARAGLGGEVGEPPEYLLRDPESRGERRGRAVR